MRELHEISPEVTFRSRRKRRKDEEKHEEEEERTEEKNQAQQVVSKRLGVSKDNTWGTINRSTGP